MKRDLRPLHILYGIIAVIVVRMWIAPWIILCLCIVHTESKVFNWREKWHYTSYHDYMGIEDKIVIRGIGLDVLNRMKLLNRQLLPLKFYHMDKTPYQVGLVIGTLREKYRRMMDIYTEMVRRYKGQTRLVGPALWQNLPLHYEFAMSATRRLESEIHKYIDLLQTIPEKDLQDEEKKNNYLEKQKEAPKKFGKQSRKTNIGRRGWRAQSQPDPRGVQLVNTSSSPTSSVKTQKLTEEDIKREYRENYMKQHGMEGTNRLFGHY